MHINTLSEFVRRAQQVEFGRMENLTLDIEDSDPGLRLGYKMPMQKFIDFLRRKNGSVTFSVLKIQDGLPMYGEVEIESGLIQGCKFT